MGLFPPDDKEWEALCPDWAKELLRLHIPHVVGLPVYDVLYCGKYGPADGWIITAVNDCTDPKCCALHNGKDQHVGADHANGSGCGCLGSYYVADIRTEIGKKHVDDWKKANGLEIR
jgi:hypothetical protein